MVKKCYMCNKMEEMEERDKMHCGVYRKDSDGGKSYVGYKEVYVCKLCYRKMVDLGYGD